MATISNVATNGRSMSGVLSITDGVAVIENGNIDCIDINSNTVTTNDINSNTLTCRGVFRSNTLGATTIPTLVSSQMGSQISYGNTTNSGATDFTNYGSTYNTLLNGFRFWNINATQTLYNLAIIDNTQTYFKSQLVGCTAETPLSNTSIVNKTYVDSNFVNLTTNQNIGGLKIFTNVYTFFKGVITFYDIVTPFTSYSQMYHTNAQFIFRNDSFSGTITFLTRPATGTPANIVSFSTTEIRLNRAVKVYDTNSPQTGNTEILQAGTILSFTPSYNLGQYQFKTRTSTGASNTPLRIDNDGISVFGTTTCAVMEASAYRGTSATADLAIGGTTTSGTILIGTVINATLGGEIRIGTTLSTNNINGNTTFQKLPLVDGTPTVSLANQLTTKLYVDSNVLSVLTNNNIWTGTNTFNTYLPTSTISANSNNQLVNFTTLNSQGFTTLPIIQANANVWTNTNMFNNFLPTSTISATTANQLVNYTTLTSQGFTTLPLVQANNNSWTGTNTFNNYLPTSTMTPSSGTQFTTKDYCDNNFMFKSGSVTETIYGAKTFGNKVTFGGTTSIQVNNLSIFNGTTDFNAQAYFVNNPPISYITPSIGSHLTNKNYVDSNFMYKTGNINENITGEKTFQNNTLFTGSSGYFMINPSMGNGYNPASTTGTIGIIGFKDQVNDNFLLTLYGTTHASVKLNFSSGVSIGFGGGVNPNTQVLCNGTNVVIKPSLQYSGDSTIQNSAFTGAGALNGTYNLANMTIDTNGKITSLSSGLSSNNTYTGNNSFVGDLIAKSNFKLYDTSNPSIYTNLFMYLNNFAFATVGGTNTTMTFSLNNNSGLAYEAMKLTNNLITFATSNIFLSNTGATIIDSASTTSVSLFDTIASGTVSMFSSLSNSIVSMFNSSTNDATLEINANVKFRQVKLYNQVKTITGNITLDFPLEETIVIRNTGVMYIELPLITANSLGMTFNFITNNTAHTIWFESQGTDNIIKNGYTTGNTSTVVLGSIGITSVQMTCLELNAGTYSWSFFSSLPEKVTNPPGTIITMSAQITPNGYLACNGNSYSFGGIYSNLYQVIGTTYGTGGVGTFRVPNFNNGSFLRGVGGNSGAIATQQQDNIRTHTHNTTFYRFEKGSSSGTDVISDLSTGSVGSTVVASAVNTAGSPDETRPINYAVHYCIKY